MALKPPSLQDNTADADRLVEALKPELETSRIDIELSLLRQLPRLLRRWNYHVRCVSVRDAGRWRLLDVIGLSESRPIAGLAVDLGTSRVALRLIDLVDGKTLGEGAFDNPQLSVGADILARIHHCEGKGGLERLNRLIIDGINRHLAGLCRSVNLDPRDVFLIAAAGNTAMTHLLLGLNPRWIIREPYIPVVNRPGLLAAGDLGLEAHERARILVFPNIGSYFGGDLIAGILYAGMHAARETAILVDVGTNAEVVLGNANWLIACAGAAGPALEGGVTRMGMMAGPGVIDRVQIVSGDGRLRIHTIADQAPIGICGSGLIDLAAQLFLGGMVDIRGKLVPDACGHRLKQIDGIDNFVVVPASESAGGTDLAISQADLDSLIRSKAAMYTILETITSTVGVSLNGLDPFYVAGTFGSFIDPASAITIGMLPDLPLDRYRSIGNSSLGGAAMALTQADGLDRIDAIRQRITYLELNVNQDFMNRFSAAKFLPHTDLNRFASVKLAAG